MPEPGDSSPSGELRIRLLGGFRVSVGPHDVDDAAWRWRKTRAVIKLLGLTPGYRLHREQVLDRLWPEQPTDAAANNLYQATHIARRTLEPLLPGSRASSWLRLQGDTLLLDPQGGLRVDADTFEAAATAALSTQDPDALERAVRLYTGELLPEDRYEDWTAERREALSRLYLSLLMALAVRHERAGDFTQAIRVLEQVLANEPAHEEAHVGLMRLYALAGQRHDALQQFERLRETLRRDLDVDPGPGSIALHQEILAGRLPSGEPMPHGVERRRRSHPSLLPPSPRPRRAHAAPPPLPGHLPVPLTSFVGRERELAELKELLNTTRLLTLTGPGGGGKTRLALTLAGAAQSTFRDGAWWVDLSALADPALVPSAVATRLDVREQAGRSLLETLAEYVGPMNALIVLDTCEHLLEGCGRLVEALLQAGPSLRVLATSREPLGVQGEVIWRVPLMSLPPSAHSAFEDARRAEAIQLFVARARSAHPGFVLTEANAGPIADICRRLDGMPLAIELAAARARHLTVSEVLKRLDDRFRFLVGLRSAADRHRTLRAAFDWSYDLLNDAERSLFNRLSVFAGGFTLEAAQAVCAAEDLETGDILDVLSRLVDRSLVIIEEAKDGSIWYRLLDTMRQYAEEKLREQRGEVEAVRTRHRDFYLTLAERGAAEAYGPSQRLWGDRFEREHANLRAALDCSLERADAEAALRLAAATAWFWEYHGYWQEGRARLDAALAPRGEVSTIARAQALSAAGQLAWYQADTFRATALLEEALGLFRTMGVKLGICRTLFFLGLQMEGRGDYARAMALFEESLVLARDLANRRRIVHLLANMTLLSYRMGDYERAAKVAEECFALSQDEAEGPVMAAGLSSLGWLAYWSGDYRRARTLREAALGAYRQMGEAERFIGVVWGLMALGELAREQGDYKRATALFEEAIGRARRLGGRAFVANALDGLGRVALDTGDFARAAALHQESLALGKELENKTRVAFALYSLGLVARYQGDLMNAAGLLEESLNLHRDMGHLVGAASTLHALGVVAHDRGDYERAAAFLRDSLCLLKGGGKRLALVHVIEALAAVASGGGRHEAAVRLLASASAARASMETPLPPCDRPGYDRVLAAGRTDLGEEFFAKAWAAGRAMTLEQAIEEASTTAPDHPRGMATVPTPSAPGPTGSLP